MENKISVRVITSYGQHGYKGVATGVLIAFDQCMNVILSNVFEELLAVPSKSMNYKDPLKKDLRKIGYKRQEWRKRNLKRALLCGANVVMIGGVDEKSLKHRFVRKNPG